ncbi:preprotein translocase subunit TatA [Yimella sp. cx-573]|nr:preprotein translocase subunit TatA [Yimella sp. cx-573]
MVFGIDMWELVVLIALASVLIGPERLPEYISKVRGWIKQARDYADGAKSQLKDEMGPEFADVNWRQYDPRQYDPRKIVREVLFDEPSDNTTAQHAAIDPVMDAGPSAWEPLRYDPDRSTPFDVDAT